MKKAVATVLCLVLLFGLCGQTLAFANGDGQNPVMNFIGVYHYDGARLLVEAEGSENARITVVWDNGSENARWFMTGRFDPKELTVYYQDCVKSVCSYQEGEEAASEEDVFFNGHGFFFFDPENNALTWQEDQEHVADGVIFRMD